MALVLENCDATGIADTLIVTGSSATAPPFGSRSEEATGLAARAGYLESPTRTIAPTIAWLVDRFNIVTAPVLDGDDVGIARLSFPTGNAGIRANGGAGGTYKLQFNSGNSVNTISAIGSESVNSFSPNTWYRYRWEMNGTTWVLHVEGTLEIRLTTTDSAFADDLPNDSKILDAYVPILSSTRRWNSTALYSGASSADRPGFNTEVGLLTPDGNGNYTAWTGAFGDWDDLVAGGSNDGDTSYAEGVNTGAIERESSTLSTITFGQTVRGAKWYGIGKATAASKSIGNRAILRSSATDIEKVLTVINNTTYDDRAIVFPDVPGGAAWSQAVVDALEGGWRRDGDAIEANLRGTAIAVVAAAVDSDPASVSSASTATPNAAQFGSANAMIL